MRNLVSAALFVAALCAATSAWALDQIRTSKGNVAGTIESIKRQEVTLSRSGRTETIPTGDILSIRFDGEPPQLNVARSAALNGRYAEALQNLERLEPEVAQLSRAEIKQDFEFLKIYCSAQLALAGAGDVRQAGRQMREFIDNNRDSHHYYRANEVLGDLLVAVRSYDNALQYYDEVASAPWPAHQMRAAIAKGRALQAQENYSAARDEFLAARKLAEGADDPLVEEQRQIATLGLADCLAYEQKIDEAVELIEEIIAAADPEAVELRARAYNALGNAYRRAERPKEAMLAFLHVDLLYFAQPQAHAEALSNLAALWDQLKQPDRAAAARQQLQQRYANSPWSRQ